MDYEKLNQLLRQTKTLLQHQREKEILKGETFNIFSILKVESKENSTHSAFLAELLNPLGSHLKGSCFLKLFLQTIKDGTIEAESARVKVEHFIGRCDDIDKTGGRIDIYIRDGKGQTISIENKIYAGDQNAQIERYVNHNNGKNTVYYLTLGGDEPSDGSKGQLVVEKDYFTISYKQDIVNWLQDCYRESADSPILRETIRQYIILIKKLTNTMNTNEEQKELFGLIIQNSEEAATIANNYKNAIWSLARDVRDEIYKQLSDKLQNQFYIYKGSDVDKAYSAIWMKMKGKEELKLFFGVQSFSISPNDFMDHLFVGIFVFDGQYQTEYKALGEKFSNWWLNIEGIEDYDGCIVNTKDAKTVKRLNADPVFRTGFVNHVTEHITGYVERNFEAVARLLNDTKI